MYNFFIPKSKPIFIAHETNNLIFDNVNNANNSINLLNKLIWNKIKYVDLNYLKLLNNEYVFNKNIVVNINLYIYVRSINIANNYLQLGINYLDSYPIVYIPNNNYNDYLGSFFQQLANANQYYNVIRNYLLPFVNNSKFSIGLNTQDKLEFQANNRCTLFIYTQN